MASHRTPIMVRRAPVHRYHVWQTPEARTVAAPRPVMRAPRWLTTPFKLLLGRRLYAHCRSLVMGMLAGR